MPFVQPAESCWTNWIVSMHDRDDLVVNDMTTRKEAEDWIKKTEVENRLVNTSRDYTVVKRINI